MAVMIPSILPRNPPPGEREVFMRLRDDPATAGWIVLHSLDIAVHPTQVSGEADFVILIPGVGVLVVEVKSHNHIHRGEDGVWYLGSDVTGESRGPLRQAADAMHALRKSVLEKRPDLGGVIFWSAAVFPYATGRIVTGEWHPWQLIDSARFRSGPVSRIFTAVLAHARELLAQLRPGWFTGVADKPSVADCQAIAAILRPKFEMYQSPAARAKLLQEELKTYTEEQTEFLDAMDTNQRLFVQGPAGTGKTLLAIESARRSVVQGRRTGLFCFNRLLGFRLTDETRMLPDLTCASIHKLMCDVAGVRPPEDGDAAWWTRRLPELAVEALLKQEGAARFDELVLDEFQDLLVPAYLDFFDLLLEGGFAAGRWRAFGDFERQSIFHTECHMSLADFLQKRAGAAAESKLSVNCRNLPRVVHHVHRLGRLVPGYRRIRRPDDGVDPEFHFYARPDEQAGLLRRVLLKIESEGFPARDIVVLSPLRIGAAVQRLDGARVEPYVGRGAAGVQWATIHGFKGLEAAAVVLTDISDVDSPSARDLFYIGLTRSVQRLVVCASEQVSGQLFKLLQTT
jgi:hypothetical protein